MRETGTSVRLSAQQKAELMAKMRAGGSAAQAPHSRSYDTSFQTLPAYRQFEFQRAFGDVLGLSNPFYRLHEARAGAQSRIAGADVVNFASYDYLGLNGHPAIEAAITEVTRLWGTSVSASRITAGERPFHRALEAEIAGLYEAEDALTFVGGHAAAVSTIAALMGPRDLVLLDELCHNGLTLGAQLSGAARRVFSHNYLDSLENLLASARDHYDRALIVSEGLFSMDGDSPNLARLIEIKKRWGCWLMMDEAHALGVMGTYGHGSYQHFEIDPAEVDIWYGTLSKTLVSCGGYVAGARPLVDFLRFAAPGMVYSVGMAPQAAEAARVALQLMRAEPERVTRLRANSLLFSVKARTVGLNIGSSQGLAVIPVFIGDSLRTIVLSERLLKRGINTFPIIPPAVPEQSARLRFFLSAQHRDDEIERAVSAVAEELERLEVEGVSITAAAKLFPKV